MVRKGSYHTSGGHSARRSAGDFWVPSLGGYSSIFKGRTKMAKRTRVVALALVVGMAVALTVGFGAATTGSAQVHSHQHREWGPIHFCWGDCTDDCCPVVPHPPEA